MNESGILNTGAVVSLLGLVAVWMVYPSIVWLWALYRRAQVGHAESAPKGLQDIVPNVSIILATRDDEGLIRSRVGDCLAVDYPSSHLEVVVATDTRGDTATLVFDDPRVRCFPSAGTGKAAALNAGVRNSRGDILVFTDTHQRFGRDAVRLLVESLAIPGIGAVSGRLELATAGSRTLMHYYWAMEWRLRRDEAQLRSSIGVTGAIWAMHRALWAELPSGLILDDVYTPMRLVLEGWRVAFQEHAHAWETRSATTAHEYRRKVRTLAGIIQLARLSPAVLSPVKNPVWIHFVFHKLLRLASPYFLSTIILWAVLSLTARVGGVAVLILGIGAISVYITAERVRSVRAFRDLIVSGIALQAASFVGLVHGIRGKWDVWR